jgi:hypothetical protein
MGDRAVIGFKESQNDTAPIWLYSHWGGSSQRVDLARALNASRKRWSDSSYATRIAVSHIIADDWSGELNYGLSAGESFCMPDYDFMCEASNPANVISQMNFEEFISLAENKLPTFDDFVSMTAGLETEQEEAAV